MQAAAVAALAAVDWRGAANTAWTWSWHQASTGQALLLAMPTPCKLAITHTALVCSGYSPEYTALPGFPPLSLSWGWLVLGLVLGVLLGSAMVLLVNWWARRQGDRARMDVLNYVIVGGQVNVPRLHQLAQAAGIPDGDMLRRVANVR